MRRNRYLHPGDYVPEGQPKKHVRKDDGRTILYWDLPEERVFLQAFDSLGNYRVLNGVVQAPRKVFTCAVCRNQRSPDQVCSTCNRTYSVNGELPVWILELVKLQDKAIQNGYQVQSLDSLPTGPPLKTSHWPLNRSRAFTDANQLIQSAQREAERTSSFCSGMKLQDYRAVQRFPPLQRSRASRWNGYRSV